MWDEYLGPLMTMLEWEEKLYFSLSRVCGKVWAEVQCSTRQLLFPCLMYYSFLGHTWVRTFWDPVSRFVWGGSFPQRCAGVIMPFARPLSLTHTQTHTACHLWFSAPWERVNVISVSADTTACLWLQISTAHCDHLEICRKLGKPFFPSSLLSSWKQIFHWHKATWLTHGQYSIGCRSVTQGQAHCSSSSEPSTPLAKAECDGICILDLESPDLLHFLQDNLLQQHLVLCHPALKQWLYK